MPIKIKIRRNLGERCQKGYKTHPTRKTKKMFGRTYRNCVKAEGVERIKENKLDSYSNIWKSWKTIDDFDKWNRSQVLALAKHRKGQGKFNFKFYDKVYEDLKYFVNTEKLFSTGNFRIDDNQARKKNIFWHLYDRDDPVSDTEYTLNIYKHEHETPEEAYKISELIVHKHDRENHWKTIMTDEPRYVFIRGKNFHYDPRWGYEDYETPDREFYISRYVRIPNVWPLKKHLKNMESLRETYPWNKKHLPTIQKQLGIYEGKDPKKGTGKKPKGSGRRLYTDENPSDTVSVKFSTVQDIKDTFSKASFKSKSHKRQSQIINLVHQRVRAAYQNAKDPDVKKRLKKAFDYAKKRKESSKRKTQRMRKNK